MSDPLFPWPDPTDWRSFALLQHVLDTFPDPIFVKDRRHTWIACNQAFCELIGQPYAALIGRSDPDFWPPEQAEIFWRLDDEVFDSGEARINEEPATGSDGVARTIWTRKYPMRDAEGHVVGLCGIITDLTAIKRRQEQVERLAEEVAAQQALIASQTILLDQLAVPVIQVWNGILLVPLIGGIDSRRASQVLDQTLAMISRSAARWVIIDITGVPVVDTAVAGYLVRAVQAAQLLGCQSILVGIRPEIAQTLVGLGVDFSHIPTRATLQGGLEVALPQAAANHVNGQRRRY